MDWRTVNMSMAGWSLTSLKAFIVTEWDMTDWEGVPNIITLEGWKDKPVGNDS